jgi:hypothetical protein
MITINGYQRSFGRAAEAVCLFQYRVEDRHEIARRGVDHLQYLGSGGLLLERFTRFRNKSRVLHRDDSLRREILQQRDLFVRKRPHFAPVDDDPAEERLISA